MKILMICDGMDIGGCETHIFELILALRELGEDVTLVCSGGCYQKKLAELGIRTVILPTKHRNPISLIYTAIALRKLMREGFDVVHAHTRAMALLCRLVLPLPLCVSVHLNFRTNRLLRRICHFGDATLAVSKDIIEYLKREYHLDEAQILLTHNGINLSSFCKQRCAKGIVHLSRLDKDRSLCALLLCEVAPKILSHHSGIYIHIFGDGNDAHRVSEAARAANDALGYEGVILHGATADIAKALRCGNIFVGASRAALEAMASGCATVVAGNDGYGGRVQESNLKPLIESNFCARGMPRADARKLAIDLCYLLSHEDARKSCAGLCRQIVKTHYTREGMARDALEAYRLAMKRYHGRATLIGYYGFGNFGDTLTLHSLCRMLPHHKLFISCANKSKEPLSLQSEKNISFCGRYLGAFIAILRSREVIFGGGTLFQNSTSIRSLLYYCSIAFFARLFNRRIHLLAGGVDVIQGTFSRLVAKKALLCFDTLAVRTERDRSNLYSLLGSARIEHLPDAAFLEQPQKARALPYAAIILNKNENHASLSSLLDAIRGAALIPLFVVFFDREDAREALRLGDLYGIRIATNKDSEELFSLLAHATLVVSERLHGAIASLLVHRPCFLLTHSEKAMGLYEDVKMIAQSQDSTSAIISFSDHTEITVEMLESAKKEAAGKTYGFDKIIGFFRECWRGRLMPLLREPQQELPQREPLQRVQRQASPWEPSS